MSYFRICLTLLQTASQISHVLGFHIFDLQENLKSESQQYIIVIGVNESLQLLATLYQLACAGLHDLQQRRQLYLFGLFVFDYLGILQHIDRNNHIPQVARSKQNCIFKMFPDSQQEITFELHYPSFILDLTEKGLFQVLSELQEY